VLWCGWPPADRLALRPPTSAARRLPPPRPQDYALPTTAPRCCRLWLQQRLMLPPPPSVARDTHAACAMLSAPDAPAVPDVYVGMNASKIVNCLRARQTGPPAPLPPPPSPHHDASAVRTAGVAGAGVPPSHQPAPIHCLAPFRPAGLLFPLLTLPHAGAIFYQELMQLLNSGLELLGDQHWARLAHLLRGSVELETRLAARGERAHASSSCAIGEAGHLLWASAGG